jgi:hypothetical protein
MSTGELLAMAPPAAGATYARASRPPRSHFKHAPAIRRQRQKTPRFAFVGQEPDMGRRNVTA